MTFLTLFYPILSEKMLPQAAIVVLAASSGLAATVGGRYDSSALKYSSRAIARTIRKCGTLAPPTVYFPLNFRKFSKAKSTDIRLDGPRTEQNEQD